MLWTSLKLYMVHSESEATCKDCSDTFESMDGMGGEGGGGLPTHESALDDIDWATKADSKEASPQP